jgi:hypothetical protein
MKIQHKLSKQIIDVPIEHAEMLFEQNWEKYDGMQDKGEKTSKKVIKKTGE